MKKRADEINSVKIIQGLVWYGKALLKLSMSLLAEKIDKLPLAKAKGRGNCGFTRVWAKFKTGTTGPTVKYQ